MRIGIIGPNRIQHLNAEQLKERKNELSMLAKTVADSGFDILLTPDKNSLLEFFGQEYLKNDGKKIYEIVPLNDDYEQYLNTELGEVISCDKWPNQPARFNEECDIMICTGLSGMTLAEIGFSGYYKPKAIYIIKEFISQELPREIQLDVKYIKLDEVKEILEKIK